MTEEQFSMELAIRVAKWKTQLGDLCIRENALSLELAPQLVKLENLKKDIALHEGALKESFNIQVMVEDSLRAQGKLGRDPNKHIGSVLDQVEKEEVRTLDNHNTGTWAKSGSVSL